MSKIKIVLKSAGDCPQINGSFKLSTDSSITKVSNYIKKALGLQPNQTIFLFYKEIAIYPDMTLGDIVDRTPNVESLDINYSLGQAFG